MDNDDDVDIYSFAASVITKKAQDHTKKDRMDDRKSTPAERHFHHLCEFEWSLLVKIMLSEPIDWGAAVGQAMEVLWSRKLIDRDSGKITTEGTLVGTYALGYMQGATNERKKARVELNGKAPLAPPAQTRADLPVGTTYTELPDEVPHRSESEKKEILAMVQSYCGRVRLSPDARAETWTWGCTYKGRSHKVIATYSRVPERAPHDQPQQLQIIDQGPSGI